MLTTLTADDILKSNWTNEYATFKTGKSHLIDDLREDKTACGIDLEEFWNWFIETLPSHTTCLRCEKTETWKILVSVHS
jgi:hypothetical protein